MDPFCSVSPQAWSIIGWNWDEYLTEYGFRQPGGVLAAMVVIAVILYLCQESVLEARPALGRLVGRLSLDALLPRDEAAGGVASSGREGRLGGRAAMVLLVVTALSFGASVFVHFHYMGAIPHVLDSIAHDFQAKVMAGGGLSVPAFPVELEDALWIDFLEKNRGRVFSRSMPLFPALLALARPAGLRWFVNPLFNLAAVALLYLLLRRLFGAGLAFVGTVMAASSPFFVFMGAGLMDHPPALCASVLCLFGCHRFLSGREIGGAAVLSVGAGIFLLERPYSGFFVVLPLAASVLLRLLRRRPGRGLALRLAALSMPLLVCAALLLAYNRELTGDALTLPRMLSRSYDRPGFGPHRGPPGHPYGHNLARGLLNQAFALLVLSDDLYGWPGLSMLPVMLGLALLLYRRDGQCSVKREFLDLVGVSVPLYFAAYACYHGQALYLGVRLYYCLLPHFVILSLLALEELVRSRNGPGRRLAGPLLLLGLLSSLATYYPHRLQLFRCYGGVDAGAAGLAERLSSGGKDLVVLVPRGDGVKHLFLSFASFNDPCLERGPLFMRDLPSLHAAAIREALGWKQVRLVRLRLSGRGEAGRTGPEFRTGGGHSGEAGLGGPGARARRGPCGDELRDGTGGARVQREGLDRPSTGTSLHR